jgi:hypothetical protein
MSKNISRTSLNKYRPTWQNKITNGKKYGETMKWIQLVQDGTQWHNIAITVMKLRGPQKMADFSTRSRELIIFT